MQLLPVFKDDTPYSADYRIGGATYNFTFNYNSEGDFFTVGLARGDETLVLGEKIIFGRMLFASYFDERFPLAAIVPIDLSGQVDRVGWEELGNSVFLVVVTEEELGELADE